MSLGRLIHQSALKLMQLEKISFLLQIICLSYAFTPVFIATRQNVFTSPSGLRLHYICFILVVEYALFIYLLSAHLVSFVLYLHS